MELLGLLKKAIEMKPLGSSDTHPSFSSRLTEERIRELEEQMVDELVTRAGFTEKKARAWIAETNRMLGKNNRVALD